MVRIGHRFARRARKLVFAGFAGAACFASNHAFAITLQNFDDPGTNYVLTQHGDGPGPVVAPDGLQGNYLALLQDNSPSSNNSIAFDLTDARSDSISIEFDYVMPDDSDHTGCCGQRADGFSLLLLNADQHGATGAAPNGVVWERPAVHNSLAISFDIFSDPPTAGDGNTITVARNGQQILVRDVDPATEMLLNNSTGATIRPNHVIVNLDNLSTNPTISMYILPDTTNPTPPSPVVVFDATPLPMVMPFASGARLAIGGRTGAAFTSVLMDNISADFASPIPFAASNGMSQDFDNPGTFYQTALIGGPAAPTLENGDAGSNGKFLRLAHDQPSQNTEVAFDAMSVAGPRHQVSFDYRMPTDAGHTGCCGERADGFGVLLLNTANYGDSGTIMPTTNWETVAEANALGLGFGIFGRNSITVSLDGVQVTELPVDMGVLTLNNGVFNRVDATIREDGGNSLLSISITPDINGTPGTPIIVATDLLLSGLDLNDYRLAFGARTGGAYTSLDIDNVNVSAVPEPSTMVLVGLGAVGLVVASRRKRT